MSDPNIVSLHSALLQVNPKEFLWTGPDPEHHFSIAIVPNAAVHLFSALRSWSNLAHLTLTNLSFPSVRGAHGIHTLSEALGIPETASTLFPSFMSDISLRGAGRLETLVLSKVTFLDPLEIARIAYASPALFPALHTIRIVDAYQGSIWGPRVRDSDVERAVFGLHQEQVALYVGSSEPSPALEADERMHAHLKRVQQLVRCEAKTERIMGGDRMDIAPSL